MKKLKLPPYGVSLKNNLAKGIRPKNDVFLFTGQWAWRKAKGMSHQQVVLALPEDRSPYDYFWPVQGCDVLVFMTSDVQPEIILRLAHALLNHQASIVRVAANDTLYIYRR